MKKPSVVGFDDLDRTDIELVGGKGATLAELSRLRGIRVPEGFCISTRAFTRVIGAAPALDRLLDQLAALTAEDREAIRACAAEVRAVVEDVPIPHDIEEEIGRFLARLGEDEAYAVRSSATAEDLPTASFAGQQDSFLNVIGKPAILEHVSRCWASLFTERAVAYRVQHGFDHRRVLMAVVVQKMLRPRAAGILFTAEPVTGNRRVTAIEATAGLGEALVSGRVDADRYLVRAGQIVEKALGRERPDGQVLEDQQIVRLARLGRQIEAHLGQPQDIEWCLVGDDFHIVQSRPITTLFPIPDTDEPGNRVYLSVGHQQMMTDPMKPLGLSLRQLTAARRMHAAAGRLFVDITRELSSPASRNALLDNMGSHDPLMKDALTTLIERGDFIEEPPSGDVGPPGPRGGPASPPAAVETSIEDAPALVADLIAVRQASVDALARDIRAKSGTELLDFIAEDFGRMKRSITDPRSMQALMAGFGAAAWINAQMLAWLGESNAADTLAQSVPNNVSSEMGLALLDVADVIRPHPEVAAYLRQARDDGFFDGLPGLDGGRQAHDAIRGFLDKYGMRCVGEIDVTRTRWREAPTTLVPLILGNVKNFEPGESRRMFARGRREAVKKERELLERLKELPDGQEKAEATQRMIHRLRALTGYREYPKYEIISRYCLYRQALLEEAERLVGARVLHERDDIYYLTFQELREVVGTHRLDAELVRRRKAEHARHWRLSPPRVITSDGEVFAGRYHRGRLPADALVGLAVSAGVVEGRARVLSEMAGAELEAGDILVTTFTDPGWTPVFVSLKGLVTEVGGLMTHGAVVAREYGLPAVVGVEHATRLIKDGQRIRVHGSDGYVQILT